MKLETIHKIFWHLLVIHANDHGLWFKPKPLMLHESTSDILCIIWNKCYILWEKPILLLKSDQCLICLKNLIVAVHRFKCVYDLKYDLYVCGYGCGCMFMHACIHVHANSNLCERSLK